MNALDRSLDVVVIGVGNRNRGDDGVGPLVVDAVRRGAPACITTTVVDGDLSDLPLRWNGDQTVVIIDACRTGAAPGTIRVFNGLTTALPTGHRPISSHGIGLADAIEMARMLDRMPRSLTVFAIEAHSFDHMAPASAAVARAAGQVARRILNLVAD